MSESLLLSLLLLSCVSVSLSSIFILKDPVVGLVACRPHQIQAFTMFKNEFDTRGCNHSDDLNGVWCDNTTGVVTKLKLRACLSGTLKRNSSLFQFHQLRHLDLSQNNFTSSSLHSEFGNYNKLEVLSLKFNGFLGPIPSSFNHLSMLSYLDLSHNELTGSFPVLRNLSKLRVLELSNNRLSGTLNSNSSLFEFHQLRYLNLDFNNFTSSSLPFEIGNLTKLEVLSLSSNGFFGQVPTTISNLTRLTELYLFKNKLTGSFPLLQNLTKLSVLSLSGNRFSGTIPPYLFTMPALLSLDLRQNHFTGPIEVSNSSFSYRLEHLLLGDNYFERQILEHISKFTNLKILDLSFLNTSYPIDFTFSASLKYLLQLELSGNSISPTSLSSVSYIPLTMESLVLKQCDIKEFPNILRTLKNLKFIDISHNRIIGKIPEWLWSLPRLNTMIIANNSFTGFEGSAEGLLNSSVKMLDLTSNIFEGALPNLPLSMNIFSARKNSFTGDIPLSICNRSPFVFLDLSYNNITGPIPPCLSSLIVLNLRKNNLEGSIPDNFYTDAPLQTLDVGYNRLTGKLPKSLLNCSSLQFLGVDNNKIKDTFPFWLKSLQNLQVLILRSNKLYGPISPPHQVPLGFPQLHIFEISDNKFTGSLSPRYFENWKASLITRNGDDGLYMEYHHTNANSPIYYFYANGIDLQYKGLSMKQEKVRTSYATIDFSGNRLEGHIPESIGLLKELIALNLSNNAFTGHIPSSFANLMELESLDLSRNQLSGPIPNELKTLSFLAYINVSHNQLKGEIPQGTQIIGQPKSSFEGNAGLCGFPLKESCFGTNAPPTQEPKEEDQEEEEVLNWKAVALSYGPGVLFGLAIAQVVASYKPEWLVKIIGRT